VPNTTAAPDFSWLPTTRTCACEPGRLNCLTRPQLFELGSTVLNVTSRVRWQEKHSGRFIPQVPEKFIKLFSHTGETVLDPFSGSGTTSVVAQALERNSIGIDVNPRSVEMARARLNGLPLNHTRHEVALGSCLSVLPLIPHDTVDMMVSSPPYYDVVDYEGGGDDQWGDISGH
jgi:DNA modification methylase